MSKEGSAYQNPIRFYSDSGVLVWEKGKKAFDNQVPGKYADDPITFVTYVCTSYKTLNKEPVWAAINAVTLKPGPPYKVLVNSGKAGDKPSTVTGTGTKVEYTTDVVLKRLNRGTKYDIKSWGSFIFISITDSDFKFINGESATAEPTTTVASTGADSKLVSVVANPVINRAEVMAFLNGASDGKWGSNPASEAAVARIVKNTAAASGASVYSSGSQNKGTSATATRAAGLSASTGLPLSSGSSPSTESSSTPIADVKNPSAPPLGKGPLPPTGQTTAILNFLPDRIIGGQNTNLPYIQQTITDFNSVTNTRERIIRTHVFNIIPNSFEFTQLSSVWNEVERSGNYAMVDWSKYNLTKCTFRFLVSGKRTDVVDANTSNAKSTIVNDGLDVSIDEQIENLRAMAGGPYPVILHNLNTLTATSFRFPYVNNTRNLQWVIADMSITATRMTPNGRKMAAAEVSITLNEYPIIARDIIALPPLNPSKIPVPKICKPKPCKPVDPINGLTTPRFTFSRDIATTEKTG
jgi:hypothetical protein